MVGWPKTLWTRRSLTATAKWQGHDIIILLTKNKEKTPIYQEWRSDEEAVLASDILPFTAVKVHCTNKACEVLHYTPWEVTIQPLSYVSHQPPAVNLL